MISEVEADKIDQWLINFQKEHGDTMIVNDDIIDNLACCLCDDSPLGYNASHRLAEWLFCHLNTPTISRKLPENVQPAAEHQKDAEKRLDTCKKGLIIIGYQGIGKTTVANKNPKIIDLESGHFWVDGDRNESWYVIYCRIAVSLAHQGYIVCVSSHEVVRKELDHYWGPDLHIITMIPSVYLKDFWIERLKVRYEEDPSMKNFKAWKNAEDRFIANVGEISTSGYTNIVIRDANYDLEELIMYWAKALGVD